MITRPRRFGKTLTLNMGERLKWKFGNLIREWFMEAEPEYNTFIKALLRDEETLEDTVASALAEIEEKHYEQELK